MTKHDEKVKALREAKVKELKDLMRKHPPNIDDGVMAKYFNDRLPEGWELNEVGDTLIQFKVIQDEIISENPPIDVQVGLLIIANERVKRERKKQ